MTKTLYVGAMCATTITILNITILKTENHIRAGFALAYSLQEAKGLLLEQCYKNYPVDQGFSNHLISVGEVPKSVIHQSRQYSEKEDA